MTQTPMAVTFNSFKFSVEILKQDIDIFSVFAVGKVLKKQSLYLHTESSGRFRELKKYFY